MGLTPEVMGDDAYGYRWARPYAAHRRAGDESGTPDGGTETETGDPGAQAPEPPGPVGQGRPVPVNAMFENDFVTQLVVVLDTDTVDEAARKVAAHVVARRVPPRDAGFIVRRDGRVLPGDGTVAGSGISALDVLYVGWAE